jgi:hypothetical protein
VVIHVVSFEDPVLKSKMKFLVNKFIPLINSNNTKTLESMLKFRDVNK